MSVINLYEQNIALDVNANQAYTVVNAKQGDQNTRALNITFTQDGVKRTLTSGSTLVFRLRKPDGTAVILQSSDSNPLVTRKSDDTVQVILSGQCLAAAGRGYADVLETTGDDDSRQVISAASFVLNIMSQPNVINIKSDSEYINLFDAVEKAVNSAGIAVNSAEIAIDSAGIAASSAEIAVNSAGVAVNSAGIAIDRALDAANSAEIAVNSAEIAIGSAGIAVSSAGIAINRALDAEAWAVGTENGIAVPSTDSRYNNNSKYWASVASAAMSGMAPLESPSFTGTPTAPTPVDGTNNSRIATTAFVHNTLKYLDAMVFKGTIGTNGTITSLPSPHEAGWTYKVITAGTYAGKKAEIGDLIICIKDRNTASNEDWTIVQSNIDGAVTGPSSAINNNIVLFDGTSGTIVKDGGYSIASALSTNTFEIPTNSAVTEFVNDKTRWLYITAGTSNSANIGEYATVEGSQNKATGRMAHAEGTGTKAIGAAAHAEGNYTAALGKATHAEGSNTIASGDYSHTEGSGTVASGDYSHAEGRQTIASGDYSHAEGYNTTAFGNYSHAEGIQTIASGDYSHAEGRQTVTAGTAAHAEGSGTTASGNAAHAEGVATIASGNMARSAGFHTIAKGRSQHVFGEYNIEDSGYTALNARSTYVEIVGNGSNNNLSNARTLDWNGNEVLAGKLTLGSEPTAAMDAATKQYVDSHYVTAGASSSNDIGERATVEGYNNKATGQYSHAEGNNTKATGKYSHAEGNSTTASGLGAHAEGGNTKATGNCSHAEGGSTKASSDYSHAEGDSTIAYGNAAYAAGTVTIAKGRSQHVFGEYNTADPGFTSPVLRGTYVEIVGNGFYNNLSNARTLDWDGNETLAGKLTIGSNPTNNMDVTTKQYVDTLSQQQLAEVYNAYPHDSVENVPNASFTDGADNIPVKSLTVNITPVQSGSGNPHPQGTNIYNSATDTTGKTISENGTITDNTSGRISDYISVVAGETYTWSGKSGHDSSWMHRVHGYASNVWQQQITFTSVRAGADFSIEFTVPTGISSIRLSFVQDDINDEVHMNTNVRPISGWTAANIVRTGKNLLDSAAVVEGAIDENGDVVSSTTTKISPLIRVKPNTDYVVSGISGTNVRWKYFRSDGSFIGQSETLGLTMTTPANCAALRLQAANNTWGAVANWQFEEGATATSYEAFGTTYAVQWQSEAGTVYGGTLTDNGNGTWTLIRTYSIVNLSTLSWAVALGRWVHTGFSNAVAPPDNDTPANIICENYKTVAQSSVAQIAYSAGLSASKNLYINTGSTTAGDEPTGYMVYRLTTPAAPITLTAESVRTLLGQNNIFADCGNINELIYRVDPELSIENVSSEASAAYTLASAALPKTGGTITGRLDIDGAQGGTLIYTGPIQFGNDVTNKDYVDSAIAQAVFGAMEVSY